MKIKLNHLNEEQEAIKEFFIKNNVNPIYAQILSFRGIKTMEELNYKYKLIPSNTLKDIEKLSLRLAENIINKKKISIVADYDCDGATSCAIAFQGLKLLGCENLNFIVPNRFKHGYGISQGVVDDLIEQKGKPDCIITVDNGIAAHAGVDYCNQLGIEVLVTDHHLPIKDKENPNCYALVNPNQEGDESGLNNMAGCGVIFYVINETKKRLQELGVSEINKVNLLPLIDLVSLGTIADVVKLDKNNRLLVKLGLDRIHKGLFRTGIEKLFKVAKKNIYYSNSRDFGFSIAPRINAAGRLEDMSIGIQCLLSENEEQSQKLSEQLNEWNVKRKSIENEMKEIAQVIIDTENQSGVSRVLYNETYHEGVIGIVAGRIKEKDNVPVIVFSPTEEEEYIKGSGRSIPEVHLRDAIDYVFKQKPELFKGFGGHAMAAGLTIKKEGLEEFKKLFEESVKKFIGDKPLTKELNVDYILKPNDFSIELAELLDGEIFGQGFVEPSFYSKLKVLQVDFLNDKETNEPLHSKITFDLGKERKVTALHFFNTEKIEVGDEIELVFKISLSRFNPQQPEINLLIVEKNKIEENLKEKIIPQKRLIFNFNR